jgi:hypothetical protein
MLCAVLNWMHAPMWTKGDTRAHERRPIPIIGACRVLPARQFDQEIVLTYHTMSAVNLTWVNKRTDGLRINILSDSVDFSS